MVKFEKETDLSSREDMIRFLEGHFRYDTLSSWNRLTSYANNMKIHSLGLPKETQDRLYGLLDAEGAYIEPDRLIRQFSEAHGFAWTAGWNGHSSGYLVLYRASRKKLDYQSRCAQCGQLNFTGIEKTGTKCGRCGRNARVNLMQPIYELRASCASVDDNADFEDWTDDELRERVKLVTDFDRLCDDIIARAIRTADEYGIEEETYYVPHTRKVLVRKTE